MTSYGFLGYGQVGQHLTEGMHRSPDDHVAAFDLGFRDPARAELVARARDSVVEVVTDPAGLAGCDLVLSVVTPASALAVARDYAAHAHPGQTYVDLNSTAPEVKAQIAEVLAPSGVRFLEGVMTGGGINLDGHRIPMSLAGPDAEAVAAQLTAAGFLAEAIGDTIGQAAAMKMLRGVVIKGLEALSVEAFVAARAYGIEDLVLASVSESLDRWSIRDFIAMLVTTHTVHCGRRSVEVRMIKETVASSGLEPLMATAAQQLFERSAAADLTVDGAPPTGFEAAMDALRAATIDPSTDTPQTHDEEEPA